MALPVNVDKIVELKELASSFLNLEHGVEGDRHKINNLFDEMNAIVFKNYILTDTDVAERLVRQCCLLVAPGDSLLLAKACQLVSNLLSHQQTPAPGGEALRLAVAWCVRGLCQYADIAVLDVLRALETLLRARPHQPDAVEELVGALRRLLGADWGARLACERDVRLGALQCLEALAAGLDERWAQEAAAVFLQQLWAEQAPDQDPLQLCKVLVSALRGLRAALSRWQLLLHGALGDALGCVKAYMLHGLPGHGGLRPQRMHPSLLAQPDPALPPGVPARKTIRLRKGRGSGPKKKPEGGSEEFSTQSSSFQRFTSEDGLNDGHSSPSASWSRTSDSEQSDSEDHQRVRLREWQARVRQAALGLMLAISKTCDKKLLFGYWPGFLPDGEPGLHTRTLATCLLKDSSPRSRAAVADILVSVLPGSRPFLQHAQSSDKTTAFTAFSVAVGNMVQELHRCVCLAVLAESSVLALVPLLRCLAALVQNTPFHRLPPGLAPRVVAVARSFLHHRDAKVQVAGLTVLGSLAALERSTAELRAALLGGGTPRLPELCLRTAGQPGAVPVRVEALQLLGALAAHHLDTAQLAALAPALRPALGDPDPTVRLHAARALHAACAALPGGAADAKTRARLWQELLAGPLVLMLQSEDHAALRAVGCDCLAALDEPTFLQLPPERHTLIIALLLGCSRDEPHVRASAVRALSMCVQFRPLREDLHFVLDTAEAVQGCLRDELLAVRMKASWSLANLTDALVLNASEDGVEDAPVSLLVQLVQCSIAAATDNEKVRCSAVRALGNLLQIVGAGALQEHGTRELVTEAVRALVLHATTGTNMKVCWNACYAMGNLLKNHALYEACWQEHVFSALTRLVQECRNFKVRISAALGLGVPCSRAAYARHYLPAWTALLRGLASSDRTEAFSEYQHRDQLVDQICLSICHLASLLSVEDLEPLQDLLVEHSDTLQHNLNRFSSRASPEKLEVLERTAGHTLTMLQQTTLSSVQHRAAAILSGVFLQDK